MNKIIETAEEKIKNIFSAIKRLCGSINENVRFHHLKNTVKKAAQNKTVQSVKHILKQLFTAVFKKLCLLHQMISRMTPLLFELFSSIVIILTCSIIVMTFFFRTVTVSGKSMTDTLQSGDKLIISTFNYTPQNGDIVVITHGAMYDHPIIKRVIATEGQEITIDYDIGDVIVDNVILDEDYIKGITNKPMNAIGLPVVVPEGYIFVMGDNREGSSDSRSVRIGLVPVRNVVGKAVFRTYPFENFGAVS